MTKNITLDVILYIMSTIPDLNTDNISFLAYYEVQDSEIKSGESFRPTELNFKTPTDGYRYKTQNAETYDNGFRVEITDHHMESTITLRAGNHNYKWITAHIDDYSEINGGNFSGSGTDLSTYQEEDRDNLGGQYDVMPWYDRNNWEYFEPKENSLYSAIKRSLNSTDFWANSENNFRNAELNLNNAGLYDYSVGGDHEISIFVTEGNEMPSSLSFTPDTTIHKAYLVGVSGGGDNYWINETYIGDPYSYAFDITDLLVRDKEIKINVQSGYPLSYIITVWS